MFTQGFLLKQLSIIFLSAVKFLIAAPVSYVFGFSYLHTLINTMTGGLLGVLFFFFLSRILIRIYMTHSPGVIRKIEKITGVNFGTTRSHKVSFTKRKRMIIKIRNRFGYAGIVILTPILLSIPIGTFLATKYYSKKPNLLAMLSLSVVVWSLVLTSITALF